MSTSDGSSKGFAVSATLHGAVAALMFFNFIVNRNEVEVPKIFELVAGEGDNYMAREAPALGTPGGVSIDIPRAPQPEPAQSAPAPQEIVMPAPKKQPEPVPDFRKKLQRDLSNAQAKARREITRQREIAAQRAAAEKRAAEARRAAAEKQQAEARRAEEQTRMTKAEFDRANQASSRPAPRKSGPLKVAKIDVEGIAKGVAGGSTANKVGGAGGRVLKTNNVDVLAAYDAMFKQRLRAEFEPPPGLSDSLMAEIEVRSNADGSLSGGRVTKSSGSAEFDRAVMDALKRVRMPARPDGRSEVIAFFFTMRERMQ
jgi:colicin import membrane protein